MAEETSARLPLAGFRVLDLSRVLAGPVCGQILADLGADVVKVERPGVGDDTRQWGPPFAADGVTSAYYLSANRGKRSVAIDLASHEGRPLIGELIQAADALIENFRVETLEKLGLQPDDLSRLNPRLVSCSISGFGRTGPMAEVPGYDFMVQAFSGLMSITGEPDGMPMKVGVAISDVLTGLYAAISILAGLLGRDHDQPARAFDLSLADCTLASLVNVAQAALLSGQRPIRFGNAHPHIVPYQVFATADGYLVLAVGNDSQWRRFCQVASKQEWSDDERFATNPARVEHRETLTALIAQVMKTATTSQWCARLAKENVPHGTIAPLDETLGHEQTIAREMVVDVVDQQGQTVKLLGSPIHWHERPSRQPAIPPGVGEHTDEVLSEWLSYSNKRIDTLRSSGAVA